MVCDVWSQITDRANYNLKIKNANVVFINNLNLHLVKLIYLNFHPFEIVSRHRDPQPEVVENYSYLFNLIQNIYKSCFLDVT